MFDLENIRKLYENLNDDEFIRIHLIRNDITVNIDNEDMIKIRHGVLTINRITGTTIQINPEHICMASVIPYHRKF